MLLGFIRYCPKIHHILLPLILMVRTGSLIAMHLYQPALVLACPHISSNLGLAMVVMFGCSFPMLIRVIRADESHSNLSAKSSMSLSFKKKSVLIVYFLT